MRLTGKAKEQFENFHYEKLIYSEFWSLNKFYGLPESMQWGVYQDWADSLGYEINVLRIHENDYDWSVWVDEEAKIQKAKTRQEARKSAIEKLNEIVNEK